MFKLPLMDVNVNSYLIYWAIFSKIVAVNSLYFVLLKSC